MLYLGNHSSHGYLHKFKGVHNSNLNEGRGLGAPTSKLMAVGGEGVNFLQKHGCLEVAHTPTGGTHWVQLVVYKTMKRTGRLRFIVGEATDKAGRWEGSGTSWVTSSYLFLSLGAESRQEPRLGP